MQLLAQFDGGNLTAKTQRDTAGDTILHQQYVLSSLLELTVTAVAAAPIALPTCETQNPTPSTGTPSQVTDQFDPLCEELEHVVDDVSFTHFVTAYAGGIDAAQIMPAMIKCFFILNLLFIANEKTTKFLVARRLKTILRIVLRISYSAALLTKVRSLFFVVILKPAHLYAPHIYSDAKAEVFTPHQWNAH